jgi:uncharacterized membrane protein YfcA
MNIFDYLPYQLSPWHWAGLIIGSICIGVSKTGITGISTVAIPLFVLVFGAKPSTGVILPMLCFADLLAVIYYRRSGEWKYIIRLIPWALAGFGLALLVDRFVSARGFKILIGICILAGLAVMLRNDLPKLFRKKDQDPVKPPSAWWFTALFGVLGGFSTMIGNAAGPIMSVFLLSVGLPKTSFIGTAAWFFMIINYLKIPVQYIAWHNITKESLFFDLIMLPFIVAGIWLGILFVKKISESHYRIAVYILTLVSTVLLFL